MGHDVTLRLLDLLIDADKAGFQTLFEARHVTLGKCGAELRDTAAKVRSKGWTTHDVIWNACLFLNTVAYDHSVLLFDLAHERGGWRRKFVTRNLALVLYEITDDVPAIFGKRLRDSLDTLSVPTNLRLDLDARRSAVSDYFKAHRLMLKQIRTVAAAHRDHDAIKLHDTIDGLDLLALLRLGIELGNLLNDLGAAAQAVLTYTSGVRPPELGSSGS